MSKVQKDIIQIEFAIIILKRFFLNESEGKRAINLINKSVQETMYKLTQKEL